MIHLNSLDEANPEKPTLITIGSFDGVHIGHQALIGDLIAAAQKHGMRTAVLTFYPHPSVVLRGRQPAFYINRPEEKADLLASLGVDITITHPFSREVSRITATEFINKLRTRLDIREIWAGADFALGHNREGTIDWLRKHSSDFDLEIRVVSPVKLENDIVSSSLVRTALRRGEVEWVARCLGRPLRIPGRVIEGIQRGSRQAFPTANLKIWRERAFPAIGIYACEATVHGEKYAAVASINHLPTIESENGSQTIRTHLLDFEDDIYGAKLTLDFNKRIRPNRASNDNASTLSIQQSDIEATRRVFETD